MGKLIRHRLLVPIVGVFAGLWFLGSSSGLAFIRGLEAQASNGIYLRLLMQDLLELRQELTLGSSLNHSEQTVELLLSPADIDAFRETYDRSLPEGFLRDSHKESRQITIAWGGGGGLKSKAKASVHGTSLTPLKVSYGALRNLLPWQENLLAPSRGGWSFKTKLSDTSLYNRARRINLLTPFDDWSLGSAVINGIARDQGVITPQEEYKLLKINGYVVGVYLAQEAIDKVMLERDYAITNFAVLKASDDWDTPDERHSSVFIKNIDIYEADGSSINAERLGVEVFERILDALNNDDLEAVSRLLDIDSFAKVSAIQKIYGTNHSTSGDNAKYIYDASRGKLFSSFRAEGSPEKLVGGAQFDLVLNNYQPNPIIEALERDQRFITLRNVYLSKIVVNAEKINRHYDLKESELDNLGDPTFTTSVVRYRSSLNRETINHNISVVSDYLSYTKVYVLESMDDWVRIMVDGFLPVFVEGCGVHQALKPSNRLPGEYNYIELPRGCRENLAFVRSDGSSIEEKDIYWKTKASTHLDEIVSMQGITEQNDGSFVIGPGVVVVNNSFKFPLKSDVIVRPGTTVELGHRVSIKVSGNFHAVGTEASPIIFKRRLEDKPFGSIALIGGKADPIHVTLSNFELEGGSEAEIDSVYFSSQMSIHGAVIDISSSSFSGSVSDDGLNLKYSDIVIADSRFFDNYGDQVDLDFCRGRVNGSTFSSSLKVSGAIDTDGLDMSGSTIEVSGNVFSGFSDKGLSIGEESDVVIRGNQISGSKFGIAVKDGSRALIFDNMFRNNGDDLTQYVKKPFFSEPLVERTP